MKKNLFFALLLLVSASLLQAQSDRWVLSMGYMYEIYNGVERDSAIPGDIQLPLRSYSALNFSGYYVLAQKNDLVSVGVMPGITASFRPRQSYTQKVKLDALIQTPVFLMARAGAMSTSYNEQRLGIGLGIGGVFSYSTFINQYSNGDEEQYRLTYFEPQVIGEVVANFGRGNMILRAHLAPIPVRAHPQITYPSPSVKFSADLFNYGFGIVWGF